MINPIIFAQESDTIWFVGGYFKHQVRHWMRKEVAYREITPQCISTISISRSVWMCHIERNLTENCHLSTAAPLFPKNVGNILKHEQSQRTNQLWDVWRASLKAGQGSEAPIHCGSLTHRGETWWGGPCTTRESESRGGRQLSHHKCQGLNALGCKQIY